MFVRFTKNKKRRAAWFVALLYLLCITAPTISRALPGAAHCMSMEAVATSPVHPNDGAVHTADSDRHMHDHGHTSMAMSDQDDLPIGQAVANADESRPENDKHTTSGPCCALMCVSALPTPLLDVASPPAPTAARQIIGYLGVDANAPAEHYRPPIA